jgi:NarL family two-component system response regulator LiaR
MDQIRILIVDDHAVVRHGIQMFLDTDPVIQVVGEAEDGQEAVRLAASLKPDVVLMDLVMPQGDGIKAIAEIKQHVPQPKIIVLTTYKDEARATAAIKAGADGYLLKNVDGDELLRAIYTVQQGDAPLDPHVAGCLLRELSEHRDAARLNPLTKREQEVMQLVAQGLSNREVARDLNLSEGTVKIHVSSILSKLNVSSRTEATIRAMEMGIISTGKGG